jgi:CDP-diacylglycerol--glycerol-3-phosphate 3-phosphatidyltransferase
MRVAGAEPVECGHRFCPRFGRESVLTTATVVTGLRTLASVAVACAAARSQSLTLLVIALGIYWLGDMADGALARAFDQETRVGAVLDILSDRVCAAAFYLGFVWLDPTMALPVAVFLIEFMVVDAFVSLAFLAWPLRSPNYFHRVDQLLWRLNWSKPAKAVNSSAIALIMLLTRSVTLSTAIAVILLAVKAASFVRLVRIGLPVPAGCCAVPAANDGEDLATATR